MRFLLTLITCLFLQSEAQAEPPYIKLEKGKSYFVAVSPAKYDYPDFAYSIVVLFEKYASGSWKKIGHQLLDPTWDTQGIDVIEDKLFLINHDIKSSIPALLVYDINCFFETDPAGVFTGSPKISVDTFTRPNSISTHEHKIAITVMGQSRASHAIYLYDYDQLLSGKLVPEQIITYDFDDMHNASPARVGFYKHYLIVTNHYAGNISIFDLSKNPPAMKYVEGGAANRLYYPLGLAVKDDVMYVGDHIHYFIGVYDLSDIENVRFVRAFGGKDSAIRMPYHLDIFDNLLMVASLQPPHSISAYDLHAKGNVQPVFSLEKGPDTLINAPADLKFFYYE